MGMPLLAASSFVPDGILLGEPTYVGRPGSASSCHTTVAHLPQPKTRAGLPLRVCKSTAPSLFSSHSGDMAAVFFTPACRPVFARGAPVVGRIKDHLGGQNYSQRFRSRCERPRSLTP
jgi:hypothetical protein